MDILINKIAIWRAAGAKKINVRQNPLGTQYRENDGVVYRKAEQPMYRYVKDYVVEDVKYSLILATFTDNQDLVEFCLDQTSSKISKEYALRATSSALCGMFEYTPFTFDPVATISVKEKK